ncbi:MAG: hypothetical protein O3B72_03005, partial [Proteobacteria bacterium]|nr:hypothetical protein [Pseudomonadota bacterium]
MIGGNPSNSSGRINISSPDVFLGVDGKTVTMTTVGDADGGSISINGVNSSGLPDAAAGTVHVAGTVHFDTTNGGGTDGANVRIVSNAGVAG